MAGPALTIALLLKTSELVDVCRQWLPSNRYELLVLPIDEESDLISRLEPQREMIDAVVVEQQLLDSPTRDQLINSGLLFPAVVVGEVKGHVDEKGSLHFHRRDCAGAHRDDDFQPANDDSRVESHRFHRGELMDFRPRRC